MTRLFSLSRPRAARGMACAASALALAWLAACTDHGAAPASAPAADAAAASAPAGAAAGGGISPGRIARQGVLVGIPPPQGGVVGTVVGDQG